MSIRLYQRALAVFAVGAFFFLLLSLRPPEMQIHVLEGSTMGTTWTVQLVTSDSERTEATGAAIQSLLLHLDRGVFSTWASDSELSRLNQAPLHNTIPVSPELFEVLSAAATVHDLSGGVFDVTVGPLVDLWGFGPVAVTAVPEPAAVAAARNLLGMAKLELLVDASAVRKAGQIQLDLSGIAKGYAVDKVADLLLVQGYENFLVEIGGELRLQGQHPNGSAWRVAIETPQPGVREAFEVLDSRGQALALAGSGDYRNFRIENGKRLTHEIDPRDGYPIQHALAAVTVVATTAMEADAWATALMVLGPEAGRQIADRLQLDAYFILHRDAGFTASYTAGMQDWLATTSQNPASTVQTGSPGK